MKTAKGYTYTNLLNFTIEQGTLTAKFTVPMSLGNVGHEYIAKMIPHLNERINQEKKPYNTYVKQLERISIHMEQYVDAVTKLFESYDNDINPNKHRTSPIDKARSEMLSLMDDKMLKAFASNYVNEDTMNDVILPDDRDRLINATVAAMKERE